MTAEEKIKEWCQERSYKDKNSFVEALEKRFTDVQVGFILDLIEETCIHCWDRHTGCQCWNDE